MLNKKFRISLFSLCFSVFCSISPFFLFYPFSFPILPTTTIRADDSRLFFMPETRSHNNQRNMAEQSDGRFRDTEEELRKVSSLPSIVQELSAQVAILVREKAESANEGGSHTGNSPGRPRNETGRPRHDNIDYQPPTSYTKIEFPRFQRADVFVWI